MSLPKLVSSYSPYFWGEGIAPGKRTGPKGEKSATVAELKKLYVELAGKNPPSLKKNELASFVKGAMLEAEAGGKPGTPNPKRKTAFSEIEFIPYDQVACTDASDLVQRLQEHGMAVAPLPKARSRWLKEYKAWLADFAQKQALEREDYGDETPVYDEDDRATWKNVNIPNSTRGIFKQWLAHTRMQWEIREACAEVFAQIYDCEPDDLICSYDGGSITFSAQVSKSGRAQAGFDAWFHNDQPRDMDFECWQAVVYLTDSGETDPGTVVYADSREIWDEYNERYPSEGHKWGLMNTETIEELLREKTGEARIVRYEVPKYHMFIFNSKVAHCSYPGVPGCDPRFAVYVSMCPRNCLSPAELAKKIEYYEKNRMTSHWNFGPYFSANGGVRIYNARKPVIPESPHYQELTPLMRRLVGYED